MGWLNHALDLWLGGDARGGKSSIKAVLVTHTTARDHNNSLSQPGMEFDGKMVVTRRVAKKISMSYQLIFVKLSQ